MRYHISPQQASRLDALGKELERLTLYREAIEMKLNNEIFLATKHLADVHTEDWELDLDTGELYHHEPSLDPCSNG